MICAVYFDMGGVLLRSQSEDGRRKWEHRLGLAKGALARIVFENPVAGLATVGQASTDEVWAEAGRQLALARLGVAPEEAVFVDDVPANVDGARAVGMAGVQFLSPAQVRADIGALIHG